MMPAWDFTLVPFHWTGLTLPPPKLSLSLSFALSLSPSLTPILFHALVYVVARPHLWDSVVPAAMQSRAT
jgi:hypothetical protein